MAMILHIHVLYSSFLPSSISLQSVLVLSVSKSDKLLFNSILLFRHIKFEFMSELTSKFPRDEMDAQKRKMDKPETSDGNSETKVPVKKKPNREESIYTKKGKK